MLSTLGIIQKIMTDKFSFFFKGILDGHYTHTDLQRLVPYDDAWKNVRNTISDTQCLVIDEASMISKRIFEQVRKHFYIMPT